MSLPLDALSIISKYQSDTTHPAIAAVVKIDQLNGGLFIYQWSGSRYSLTYRKKEPVYNVQFSATGRHLVYESGFTGTGMKSTRFYMLEMNPAFCSEIWSGLASEYNFTSDAPYHSNDGSIQLLSLDESFIYTLIHRTYLIREFIADKPDSVSSRSEILSFRNLPAYKQP
jgi:hypothetical protein